MKKIILIISAVLSGLLAAAVFLMIPVVAKDFAVRELNKIVNTEADIGAVTVNIPRGAVSFYGISVRNPANFKDKYFVVIKKGYAKLNLKALLSKRVEIEKIFVSDPVINMEIGNDGVSNASQIFKKGPAQPSQESGPPIKRNAFKAREISVRRGVFKLTNYKLNPAGARALFDNIDITVSNLTEAEIEGDMPTTVTCSARLPAAGSDGRIKLSGKGDFLGKNIYFDLDIKAGGISLPYFVPFYIIKTPIFPKNGQFDVSSNARCRNNNLDAIQTVNIRDLELVVNQQFAESGGANNVAFGLPVMSVVNYFVNTKGALDFDFEIKGTLTDPKFQLEEALKNVLAKAIGDTISSKLSDLSQVLLQKIQEGNNPEDMGQVLKDALGDIIKQK